MMLCVCVSGYCMYHFLQHLKQLSISPTVFVYIGVIERGRG